jgi:RNA polymerase-binding transcription factor DksA
VGSLGPMEGTPEDTPIDEAATRLRLDAERQKLQGMVAELRTETTQGESEQTDERGSFEPHPGDVTAETFEREKDLSILEGLEAELAEVEAALHRLDEGTYGVDEVTGERIDPARLDALPGARTNVDTRPDQRP